MLAVFHGAESETGPERCQTGLRMPDHADIPFFLTELQSSMNQLNRGAALTVLFANRNALEFCETCKKAQPHATDRLVADISQQMRGAEIVAVIFFIVGALLLPDINRVANGGHAHQI